MNFIQYKKNFCVLLLVVSLSSLSARAEEEGNSKIKVDGFVRSLLNVQADRRGESWHEGRMTLKSKRKKGLRGELEFELETKTDAIDILEAVIDRKLEDRWRWELGYTQKRMGVEYEENRLERATIERSLIYRRLELFNYVGRETVFRLRQENEAETFNDWSVAAAYSESQNATLIANWQNELAGLGARYGVWAQVGTDRMADDVQIVYSLMNSLWFRAAASFWQVEWALGLDPQQSEFEQYFGADEDVYFTGLNALWGRKLSGDEEEFWTVLASPSLFIHDHRRSAYNSLGIMLGLRYNFDNLRVSLNAELVGTNSPVDTKKRTFSESAIRLEGIYVL